MANEYGMGQIIATIGSGLAAIGGGGWLTFIFKQQNKKLDKQDTKLERQDIKLERKEEKFEEKLEEQDKKIDKVYTDGILLSEEKHGMVCKIEQYKIKEHITNEVAIINTTLTGMNTDLFEHLRKIEKKIDTRNGHGAKDDNK